MYWPLLTVTTITRASVRTPRAMRKGLSSGQLCSLTLNSELRVLIQRSQLSLRDDENHVCEAPGFRRTIRERVKSSEQVPPEIIDRNRRSNFDPLGKTNHIPVD